MQAVRLASRRHDPLSGKDAAEVGGRWNSVGNPVVYASAHLSLAVLENLVHVQLAGDLPEDRHYWVYELAQDDLLRLDRDRLPEDWRERESGTRAIGDEWLVEGETLALVVPSAVVSIEENVLINPDHPDCPSLTPVRDDELRFDPRLAPTT